MKVKYSWCFGTGLQGCSHWEHRVPGGVASTYVYARVCARTHTHVQGIPPRLLNSTTTHRKGRGLVPSNLTPHLTCTSRQVTRREGAHPAPREVQGQGTGQALRQRVGL